MSEKQFTPVNKIREIILRAILDAIQRACGFHQDSELDLRIVSFRLSNPAVKRLADSVNHNWK